MNIKKARAGEIILRDGENGSEMYVVHSGSVLVYKTINSEKIELSVIGKGGFFGEMSLLLDPERHASVEAVTDSELLVLDKEGLLANIQADPAFAVVMMKSLAVRLTEAHRVIGKLQGEKTSLKMMYGK
jgi:CRP-like cAMP-binding protein